MNYSFKFKSIVIIAVSFGLLFTSMGVANDRTVANSNHASHGFEVKIFMDSTDVLTGSGLLTNEVLNAFDINPNQINDYAVQYLDTNVLAMKEEGWSVRIRKRDNQGSHRIQYKKRYPIINGDIEAALTEAANDGFDATLHADWDKIEVDWGYTNQTLSFALTETQKFKNASGSLGMPNLSDSIFQAKKNAPDKFINWSIANWGKDRLDASRIYGVVYFTRYEGKLYSDDITIEVWEVLDEQGTGTEYLVEVSFREGDFQTADSRRTDLINFLDQEGWLLPDDVLKTQIVLERY